jgi:ADP-ribose pyrophosphatase YjhB (NUDIX family)
VTIESETPPMATPRVAAGALFLDTEGRILLVRPIYKDYWDIPGGYVEPGESPRAACVRELREELGLELSVGPHLVVDWAPADNEGDKLLFIFDGGSLTTDELGRVALQPDELAEMRFVHPADLNEMVPPRLSRRLIVALAAKEAALPVYAEHGAPA